MKRQDHLDPNTVETPTVTDGAATDVTVVVDDDVEQASNTDERYAYSIAEPMLRNSGDAVGLIRRATLDRAAVVTVAIEQICATAQGGERWQAVVDFLREQFAEVQFQAAADRESVDA